MKTRYARKITEICFYTAIICGGMGFVSGMGVFSLLDRHNNAPTVLKSRDSLYCKPVKIDTAWNYVEGNVQPEDNIYGLIQDSVGCPIRQEVSRIVYWHPLTGGKILAQGD